MCTELGRIHILRFNVVGCLFFQLAMVYCVHAASRLERYFAHDAVEDRHGVIAPWYQGLDGQTHAHVRVSIETLKRYPWTMPEEMVNMPAYMVNNAWRIDRNGHITVRGEDPVRGDYGSRSQGVLQALTRYYAYSGDPMAIAHITLQAEHLLDYTLTDEGHCWPNFPISVPTKGQGYHYYDPNSIIQLDIAAQQGLGMLKAHQLTGNHRWLSAAKHWGDLFALNMNTDPLRGPAPWGRYACPKSSPRDGFGPARNLMTGSVALIVEFLDELLRLGYTGSNREIVNARDECLDYIRECLLPSWHIDDTWGRYYWDWENPIQAITPTAAVSELLMTHRGRFPDWHFDVRNILTLLLNRTSVDGASQGDVYSGAWAYPESAKCCQRSLDYSPLFMAPVFARYGTLTDSEWAREMARRQHILATYRFHENGMIEDDIDGGFVVAGGWFKICHISGLNNVLNALAWMPEVFGANRENHIMRSSSVVNFVNYDKGRIEYTTYNAPADTVTVLRLAFEPESITADGRSLSRRNNLNTNGFTVSKLSNGDYIVSVRHDHRKRIVVKGDDPQEEVDAGDLDYDGQWSLASESEDVIGQGAYVAAKEGSTVSYRFYGNQIRLIGYVAPSGGLADVYIDGVKQLAGIDFWNPVATGRRQVLYSRSGLSTESHDFKVVALGENNPRSNGNEIYIAGLQFSAAVGDSGFGEGGGSTETQRMLFGYTGNQPYIDSAGNPWLPGTEFVTRIGHQSRWHDRRYCQDVVKQAWWCEAAEGPIGNTDDPELYRYGVHAPEFWINFTVKPGDVYYARLKFAALRGLDPDRHGITILINGRKVVSEMNVAATAGGTNRAVDLVFDDIRPQNGVIEIRFIGSDNEARQDCIVERRSDAFVQAIELGVGKGPKEDVVSLVTLNHSRSIKGDLRQNLLDNGGFENGTITYKGSRGGHKRVFGWDYEVVAGSAVCFWYESRFDRQGAHCGYEAIRTYIDDDHSGHSRIFQDVSVRPGVVYEATAWVKTADLNNSGFGRHPNDSAGIILQELNENGHLIIEHPKEAIRTAGPWTMLSKQIAVGARTAKIRYILDTVITCKMADGYVTYDDCAFMRIGEK